MHGYADQELDSARTSEIEHHLRDCARCAQAYQNLQTLQTALGAETCRFKPPVDLRQRIQASLRTPSPAQPEQRITSWAWRAIPWPWVGLAAGLALVALLTWGFARVRSLPSAQDLLIKEVVASHVRSLLPGGTLVKVASSDKHTVKPWFEGKVDYSFDVANWEKQGFPLLGGRLDYFNDHRVAALVYQRGNHIINLFIWKPGQVSDSAPEMMEYQGFRLVHWNRAGLAYWVVSNVAAGDLEEFVQLVRQ
jgi:anti-sigma factor RsiW